MSHTVEITDTIGTAGTMRVPTPTTDDALTRMFPGEDIDELAASGGYRVDDVPEDQMTEDDWQAWWLTVAERGRDGVQIAGATVTGIPPAGPVYAEVSYELHVTRSGRTVGLTMPHTWTGLYDAVREIVETIDGEDATRRLAAATRAWKAADAAAQQARRAQYDAVLAARASGVAYKTMAEASGLSRSMLDRIANDRRY